MSNLLILQELIKDKNLGIPYFFYCNNYNNLKNNTDINFSINKNDIINDIEYNKILEYNLVKNNKLTTIFFLYKIYMELENTIEDTTSHDDLQNVMGGKRRHRRSTRKGMRRKTAHRAYMKAGKSHKKSHKKLHKKAHKKRRSTRKGMRRKTARRAYMKAGKSHRKRRSRRC
jgi:hypothetical protein